MANYNANVRAGDDEVSARKTRSKPIVAIAKPDQARDLVAVAKDLRRVEQRQTEQRAELATTDAELAALQKELKALIDLAGKGK
jgi:septal ring factor EnvC (AmiA/AmiB activator)